jgi:hypothetical protein
MLIQNVCHCCSARRDRKPLILKESAPGVLNHQAGSETIRKAFKGSGLLEPTRGMSWWLTVHGSEGNISPNARARARESIFFRCLRRPRAAFIILLEFFFAVFEGRAVFGPF